MMRNRKVWGVLGLLLALAVVVGYGQPEPLGQPSQLKVWTTVVRCDCHGLGCMLGKKCDPVVVGPGAVDKRLGFTVKKASGHVEGFGTGYNAFWATDNANDARVKISTWVNPQGHARYRVSIYYYGSGGIKIDAGDLLFLEYPGWDPGVPGWDHVAIVDKVRSGDTEWYVIEASKDQNKVQRRGLLNYVSQSTHGDIQLDRVSTTAAIKDAAVEFAYAQLGKPYDTNWTSKQVYGPSYYCSELVWAAYMHAGRLDLDAGTVLGRGVAPKEIDDSPYISSKFSL